MLASVLEGVISSKDDLNMESELLRAHAIEAHRAYMIALIDAEACHEALCQPADENATPPALVLAYLTANGHLDRCRRRLALLLDRLGYVPPLSEIRLPDDPIERQWKS